MKKTILVTGKGAGIGESLAERYLADGWNVVVAEDGDDANDRKSSNNGGKAAKTAKGGDKGPMRLTWTRRSVISSSGVVLNAVNTFGGLDEVVIVDEGAPPEEPFHDVPGHLVENVVDARIKGFVYLARESLRQFMRNGAGRLTAVIVRAERTHALEEAIQSGIRSLCDALMEEYGDDSLVVQGAIVAAGAQGGIEQFADFMQRTALRTAAEKQKKGGTRWYQFAGKQGLFAGNLFKR